MGSNSIKYHINTSSTLAIIITLILAFSNFALATPSGGTASFSWLPNTESDLAGYKIHYGIDHNGPYNQVVDAGNPPPANGRITGSVYGLLEGATYYFVATAYNQSGLESDFSTEVAYTCPSQTDTTPPVGSIVIAAGAATTSDINITLTLSASDTTGSVTEMKFSNDNVNWSDSEIYNVEKNWALSEETGIKTVYVKFKDNADNWSSNYSDSIELVDTTQPLPAPILRIKSTGGIHFGTDPD